MRMPRFRGVDTELGWVNRELADLRRVLREANAAREVAAVFAALPTTSESPNVFVDPATGALARSISSARYKVDVGPTAISVGAVLGLVPVSWRDAGGGSRRHVGLIAEDVEAAGLGWCVTRDAEGRVESLAYDRLAVALLAVVQSLAERVAALEAS